MTDDNNIKNVLEGYLRQQPNLAQSGVVALVTGVLVLVGQKLFEMILSTQVGLFTTFFIVLLLFSVIQTYWLYRRGERNKELSLQNKELSFLQKWNRIEEATELVDFTDRHLQSDYAPKAIAERENLSSLRVLGNGCSKWTATIPAVVRVAMAKQISNNDGYIKFIASCPVFLNAMANDQEFLEKYEPLGLSVDWLRAKSRKNAQSILKLRETRIDACLTEEEFQIRTYKSLASLRIVIVNEQEYIVGHYQESATADSKDSPLIVFARDPLNDWGFGAGFSRVFEEVWLDSERPTDEEWAMFEAGFQ